ncbi:MAG: RpoD/SigA family RNA polymerase sigma factor [Desmonostoc vinosum HA7617-LM4]|jgi:RNA polymerase nonessential primary-like sigma factor|nr:RpoD/SigA family RNA polymerase sigma factor [Desmonostoc vinosum HA7617-LM4]
MSNPTPDTIGSYLKEIGRYPLLTREQELSYALQVHQMVAIEQVKATLVEQQEREPTTSELATVVNKTEAEVTQILLLGQRAKEKMVTANLRLVVSIAKKYQNRNLEFPDLLQEGALGLQRGIEKFDPNRGYRLSTYAYWWIQQSITRAIAEKSRTIRIPIHVNEKLNKIKKTQRELSQTLGRTATVTEVAEALKLKPSQIRECLNASKQPVSLEKRIGKDQESELVDILPSDGISSDEYITTELLRDDLRNMLSLLTPIQQQVLALRFGLDDGHELNLREVGERLNLSRERIRQIEVKAMNILRRRSDDMIDYFAS